jgi:hypothetical protein
LVSFKIRLSTIQIHSNILTYIKIPSKYIAIPSLNTSGICYNTINILQYASIYFEIIMQPLYFALLCLVTVFFQNYHGASLFYQNVIALISYLTYCGQKKSRNNIQDLGLSAKCGYIMCAISVYWWTTDILVCSVCQKLANCTFIPNLRVKTSKF